MFSFDKGTGAVRTLGLFVSDITQIIQSINDGNPGASEELLPLVYEELRRLAVQKMAHERQGQTLQATALVHEAYLRLVRSEDQRWDNRRHFFAAAAEAMRRILIERARQKQRIRHGGGLERVELNEGDLVAEPFPEDLLSVNEALIKLEAVDPLRSSLVKLHCFAGLSLKETAAVLEISERTADRHWAWARAWLFREITRARGEG